MFIRDDEQELLLELGDQELQKKIAQFNPIFNTLKKYIAENKFLFYSYDMEYRKKFNSIVFSNNPYVDTDKLVRYLVSVHGGDYGKFFMLTKLKHYHLQITIDGKILINVFSILGQKYNVLDVIPFVKVDSVRIISAIGVLQHRLQLLYTPNNEGDWCAIKKECDFLVNYIKKNDSKYIHPESILDYKLKVSNEVLELREKLKESLCNKNILLNNINKLQIINLEPFETVKCKIEKLLEKYQISHSTSPPRILFDFRLRRTTFYIMVHNSKYAICDVFNSAEFELVPIENSMREDNSISSASKTVVCRFLAIDILTLNILNIKPDLKHKLNVLLYTELVESYSKIPADIHGYQSVENYYGSYEEEKIKMNKIKLNL